MGLGDAEVGQQEGDRLDRIELARSAWTVRVPGLIDCCAAACSRSCSATWADSRCCSVLAHHVAAEDVQDDIDSASLDAARHAWRTYR